jgi:PilZ domain
MIETRAFPRERSFARVMIEGSPAYGYVADISEGGLKVRIPGKIPPQILAHEVLSILFEDIGIERFELSATLKWKEEEAMSSLYGFEIVTFAKEAGQASFEMLRAYYDSMNERLGPDIISF